MPTCLLLVACGAAGVPRGSLDATNGALPSGHTGSSPAPTLAEAGVSGTSSRAITSFPFEKFTRRSKGGLADPLNLVFVATKAQILEAARLGGWYGADSINPWSSLKLINAALRHKPYPTAPISKLYVFGRFQDIALQLPTRDVAVRDHFRLWESTSKDSIGRPIWVGAGTKDVAIKFEPGTSKTSHQIDPKIDLQRELIVNSFANTALVSLHYRIPGIGYPYEGEVGPGDRYFTDGLVAVIELKNFPVPRKSS